MGLFSRLFGNKSESKTNEILFAENDEKMEEAYKMARKTFKYFWREVYWESRRIIKAHNFAMVKIRFEEKGAVEHMWINDIFFDGEIITGTLVNSPGQLRDIKVGDRVKKTIGDVSDWLIAINGNTLGGFTIHSMRANLRGQDLVDHDNKWGLNFGSFDDILYVHEQKENPNNLIEHPMCINMAPKVEEFYDQNPDEISYINEMGLSLLHIDAIAGNRKNLEILLKLGVDKNLKSKAGKTAHDYASQMGWDHILDVLS